MGKKTVASLLSEWRALLPQQTGYCYHRGLGSDASLRLDRVREWWYALYFIEERLGTSTALVEADKTAVGKRKYNRGKRYRQTGTQWVQTALEVHANADGSRSAKRLRASFVKDRTAGTLQSNLAKLGVRRRVDSKRWLKGILIH